MFVIQSVLISASMAAISDAVYRVINKPKKYQDLRHHIHCLVHAAQHAPLLVFQNVLNAVVQEDQAECFSLH